MLRKKIKTETGDQVFPTSWFKIVTVNHAAFVCDKCFQQNPDKGRKSHNLKLKINKRIKHMCDNI